MAYNPFTVFRKHQRSIFAVLTVMCMIVFIAQFGAGDVFQRAMAYFGQGRDTGPRGLNRGTVRLTFMAVTAATDAARPAMNQLDRQRDQIRGGSTSMRNRPAGRGAAASAVPSASGSAARTR